MMDLNTLCPISRFRRDGMSLPIDCVWIQTERVPGFKSCEYKCPASRWFQRRWFAYSENRPKWDACVVQLGREPQQYRYYLLDGSIRIIFCNFGSIWRYSDLHCIWISTQLTESIRTIFCHIKIHSAVFGSICFDPINWNYGQTSK